MDDQYSPLSTDQIITLVVCSLAFGVFMIIAQWKVYVKGRKPG
jgi:hypothetical protein